MSTVNKKLTNLADEIRVLSGTTEPLGLTEMATNVNDANDEVTSQTDLIAQVVSALQGKSVPGGGEDVTAETETYTDLLTDLEAAVDALPDAGSGGVETCEVTIESTWTSAYQGGRAYYSSPDSASEEIDAVTLSSTEVITVAKDSIIALKGSGVSNIISDVSMVETDVGAIRDLTSIGSGGVVLVKATQSGTITITQA